jgi:aminoglycoside phosphotransferase
MQVEQFEHSVNPSEADSVIRVEVDLTAELAGLVEGGVWEPVPGTSRASVWEVGFDDDRPSAFVKAGNESGSGPVVGAELERWRWLGGRVAAAVPVPQLLGQQDADPVVGRPAAFVTAAAEGVPELHWFVEGPAAAEMLGTTLRAIHALPVDACPFEAGPRHLLGIAEERVVAGLVDSAKFHAAHQRYSPAELLGHAKALLPPEPEADDRVVVHGDWSVGNLIVRPDTGRLTGIVDWAGLGVGDRHLDLATAARSLVTHFGGECLPKFLAAYGWEEPDALRLEFYALLDQFR